MRCYASLSTGTANSACAPFAYRKYAMLRLALYGNRELRLRSVCVSKICDATPRIFSSLYPYRIKLARMGILILSLHSGGAANEKTSVFVLWIRGMVSGNFMDRIAFFASGKFYHEGNHLPFNVSHLWLRSPDPPGIQKDPIPPGIFSRRPLHGRFLSRGIYKRLCFASLSYVSVGLHKCASSVQRDHPS